MKLSTDQRAQLRMKFGGRCAYCGYELPAKGWHADHVEPVHREWWKKTAWWKNQKHHSFDKSTGMIVSTPKALEPVGVGFPDRDVMGNLFPSCRACNIDKHATPLELWRKQMQDRVGVCRRNYSAFRHAERFGLVQEIVKPVVFWFEMYTPPAGDDKEKG